MANIIIPFVMGIAFGGFIASMLHYKSKGFHNLICGLFDNFYKKRNGKGHIKLEDWRK